MTTPIPMPRSFTLKPVGTESGRKMGVVVGTARPGGTEIALTPGVQQISLTWPGSAPVVLTYYAKTGGYFRLLGTIPSGAGVRRLVTEVAAQGTESFIIVTTTATEGDVANQLAGLTIIPIPIG